MAEVLCRRLQTIEQAYSDGTGTPNYDAAEHLMGAREKNGGSVIDQALQTHAANKMKEEAAILKERRKAREEKKLAK